MTVEKKFRSIENLNLITNISGPTVDQRCAAGAHGVENLSRYVAQGELSAIVDLWGYDHAT